jgi:hypothetical protein
VTSDVSTRSPSLPSSRVSTGSKPPSPPSQDGC